MNIADCTGSLYSTQEKLYETCQEFKRLLGGEGAPNIGYELYHEDEFSVEYKLRFFIIAPCGCCKSLPYIYPTNTEDMLVKFRKVYEISKVIRQDIDEFGVQYTIDLLGVLKHKTYGRADSEAIAWNSVLLDEFWSIPNEDIIKKYKKRYYKINKK